MVLEPRRRLNQLGYERTAARNTEATERRRDLIRTVRTAVPRRNAMSAWLAPALSK